MELQKAITLFLGGYKPSSREAYLHVLGRMRDWIGPAREIESLRPEHILEYFQEVILSKNYAIATEQKHAKAIRTFFNWSVKVQLISRSPAAELRTRTRVQQIDRDRAMTDAELEEILNYLQYKSNPRDYALVYFLADSGCRRIEAARIRLQDMDWDRLLVTVVGKGDKPRLAAFSETCAKAIRRWLLYRSEHFEVTGEYVFSRNGEWQKPTNLSKIVRRASIRVGGRSRGTHSLRHRKGHQLSDHRIAPAVGATALGDSLQVFMAYYTPRDWERAESALREVMTDVPQPSNIVPFDPESRAK